MFICLFCSENLHSSTLIKIKLIKSFLINNTDVFLFLLFGGVKCDFKKFFAVVGSFLKIEAKLALCCKFF